MHNEYWFCYSFLTLRIHIIILQQMRCVHVILSLCRQQVIAGII